MFRQGDVLRVAMGPDVMTCGVVVPYDGMRVPGGTVMVQHGDTVMVQHGDVFVDVGPLCPTLPNDLVAGGNTRYLHIRSGRLLYAIFTIDVTGIQPVDLIGLAGALNRTVSASWPPI